MLVVTRIRKDDFKTRCAHSSWLIFFMGLILISSNAMAAPSSKSIPFWNNHDISSSVVIDHSAWQAILSKYLDDNHASNINLFSYSSVSKADHAELEKYLSYLQAVKPTTLNANEQLAYWINLYNAQTVNLVVNGLGKKGNITSIKQIRSGFFKPGPWSKKTMLIQQRKVSLDDIEHGILRPNWQDRRLHYALNCASLGCPNLQKRVFTADNAEQLLSQAEQEFINHPRAVRRDSDTLILSKLFKWYLVDFARNTEDLIKYLGSINSAAKIDGDTDDIDIEYEYGWKLNSPKSFSR